MKNYLWAGIGFFLLVTLIYIILGVFAVPQNYLYPDSEDGMMDLSDVDFENEIVMIYPDRFTHYPEQLRPRTRPGRRAATWSLPTAPTACA